jgi:hypothetical protein
VHDFASWLSRTPVSGFIQDVLWIIPLVQTVHILALASLLSSVAMIVLRTFGLTGQGMTMAETSRRFVPWIWSALLVMALTGTVLIVGEPVRSLVNQSLWIKMALLAVAAIVTFLFQRSVHDDTGAWALEPRLPAGVRAAALATLFLWFAVAVFGRWIAYTTIGYGA